MHRTLPRLAASAALAALVALAGTARADEAQARRDYDAGERAYNLGQFQKAIELFTKAYEELPEPAFLFNIAQGYRQLGDCKKALFFYNRFLAIKEQDTKKPLRPEVRQEVEGRIAELDECVKREIANKPPEQLDNGLPTSPTTKPTTTTTTPTTTTAKPATPPPPATTPATPPKQVANAAPTGGGDEEEDHEDHGPSRRTAGDVPKLISARLLVGAAKLSAGDLNTGMKLATALIAGYPLQLAPQIELDLGLAVTFTPIPFATYATSGTASGSSSGAMWGALADVGASYGVIPKLAVRVDAGAGLQVFTGLETAGNPFTMNGSPATGALSSFLARGAVSVDYAVTRNLVVTAMPLGFAYSAVPANFDSTIKSLTLLSFAVGLGYRQ